MDREVGRETDRRIKRWMDGCVDGRIGGWGAGQ